MFTYKVYRNLNNGKLSIMNAKDGLVVGHADAILMQGVEFKVSQKGRERVIKEGKKNVHAFTVGQIIETVGFESYKGRMVNMAFRMQSFKESPAYKVTYNPFKYDSFMLEREGGKKRFEPIVKADEVEIYKQGVMFAFNPSVNIPMF